MLMGWTSVSLTLRASLDVVFEPRSLPSVQRPVANLAPIVRGSGDVSEEVTAEVIGGVRILADRADDFRGLPQASPPCLRLKTVNEVGVGVGVPLYDVPRSVVVVELECTPASVQGTYDVGHLLHLVDGSRTNRGDVHVSWRYHLRGSHRGVKRSGRKRGCTGSGRRYGDRCWKIALAKSCGLRLRNR